MESQDDHSFGVLMFPWLAQGHVFPYLELGKKLSQRNFFVFLCSTPVNLSFIKEQVTSNLQLVELHLPSTPNLPPNNHTTKSLPPHLLSTLKEALDMAEPSFYEILKTLKPDLLVFDFLQPWAESVASSLNIPAIHFLTTGAAASAYVYQLCKINPASSTSFRDEFSSPVQPEEHQDRKMIQVLESTSNGLSNIERFLQSVDTSRRIVLIKTFREIEDKYIKQLGFITGKEIVPVGPLIHEPMSNGDKQYSEKSLFINEWLSKKQKASTVFISFGSEFYLTKEDREEIALGLELSKVNFIWVIRFPEGDNEKMIKLDEVLPEGFVERIGEKGMVVEGWAPQVEILRNSSIGGFASHCGWNSVMEAMKFGVPIIAMPMHLDQPMNARLVVELGVGLEVKRSEKFEREEVRKVIREVVVEEKGEEVRKKTKEISRKMREKEEEAFDDLVEKLLNLCES